MKNTCPGCRRHCSMNDLHCKYGRKYFEKLASKPKWAELVTEHGTIWQLITTAKSAKKALKEKQTTEEALLSRLTADEQQVFQDLLHKISVSLLK